MNSAKATLARPTKKIPRHAPPSVFTAIPELPLSDSSMTSNTPRHNYCLEILTSGCVSSFSEFFRVTKDVDWIETAAEQMENKKTKDVSQEQKRKRDLFVSLPYLKDHLCQAETAEREGNPELVYESYKKTATFFNSIGDIRNALHFFKKALDCATNAQLPSLQADACIYLAKGNQTLQRLEEAISYYERYLNLVNDCGTSEEQQSGKDYLMQIYEQMADKLESDKQQHMASHPTQGAGAEGRGGRRRAAGASSGTASGGDRTARSMFGGPSLQSLSTALLGMGAISQGSSAVGGGGDLMSSRRMSDASHLGTERESLFGDRDTLGSTIGSDLNASVLGDRGKDPTTMSLASHRSSISVSSASQQEKQSAAQQAALYDTKLQEISAELTLYLTKFLEMARASGNVACEVRALRRLATHCEQIKDYQQAIEHSQQLLELCESRGDTTGAEEACHALAGAFTAVGRMDEAVKYLELRMTIAERGNAEGGSGAEGAEGGEGAGEGKDLDETKERSFGASMKRSKKSVASVGSEKEGGDAEENTREQTSTLGQILIKTGKFNEAIQFFEKNFKSARKATQTSQEKWQAEQQAAILTKIGVGAKGKGKDKGKEKMRGRGFGEDDQDDELMGQGKEKKGNAQHTAHRLTVGATATMKIVPQNQSGFIEQARVNLGIAKGSLNLIYFLQDVQKNRTLLTTGKNPALEWMTTQAALRKQTDSIRPVRVEFTPSDAQGGSEHDTAFVIKVVDLEPVTPVTLELIVATNSGERLWRSRADFLSDGKGTISLPTTSPTTGMYTLADAMGFFWAMEPEKEKSMAIGGAGGGARSGSRVGSERGGAADKDAVDNAETPGSASASGSASGSGSNGGATQAISGMTMITSAMDEQTRKAILREREKLSIEEQMQIEEMEEEEKRRMEAEEADDDDDEMVGKMEEADEEEEYLERILMVEREDGEYVVEATGQTLEEIGAELVGEAEEGEFGEGYGVGGAVVDGESIGMGGAGNAMGIIDTTGIIHEVPEDTLASTTRDEQTPQSNGKGREKHERRLSIEGRVDSGELNGEGEEGDNQHARGMSASEGGDGGSVMMSPTTPSSSGMGGTGMNYDGSPHAAGTQKMMVVKKKKKKRRIRRGRIPPRFEMCLNNQCQTFLEDTRSLEDLTYRLDITLGKDNLAASVEMRRTWISSDVTEDTEIESWEIEGIGVRAFLPPLPDFSQKYEQYDMTQEQDQDQQRQEGFAPGLDVSQEMENGAEQQRSQKGEGEGEGSADDLGMNPGETGGESMGTPHSEHEERENGEQLERQSNSESAGGEAQHEHDNENLTGDMSNNGKEAKDGTATPSAPTSASATPSQSPSQLHSTHTSVPPRSATGEGENNNNLNVDANGNIIGDGDSENNEQELLPVVIIMAAGGGPTLAKGGFVWSGHVAALLASHGFASFAVAYQDTRPEGTLPRLSRCVPIEGVLMLLDKLRTTQPYCSALDFSQVHCIGYRTGAMYLLSLASRFTTMFNKIIAISPPSHIFEAPRPTDHSKPRPPFTFEGAVLPYLQLPLDESYYSSFEMTNTSRFYERALARASPSDLDAAAIRPEKCIGDILLVSFDNDTVWPSTSMCETLVARMALEKEKNDRRKKRKRMMGGGGAGGIGMTMGMGMSMSKVGTMTGGGGGKTGYLGTSPLNPISSLSSSHSTLSAGSGSQPPLSTASSSASLGQQGGTGIGSSPLASSSLGASRTSSNDSESVHTAHLTHEDTAVSGTPGPMGGGNDASGSASASVAGGSGGNAVGGDTSSVLFGQSNAQGRTPSLMGAPTGLGSSVFGYSYGREGGSVMFDPSQMQQEKELTWKHIKLPCSVDLWPPFLPSIGRPAVPGMPSDAATKLATINLEKDAWKTMLDFLDS
ncbi:uncharacterized protein MONOS_3371 [Monocercomonoides exilis]|uniref:uncharacterized protein n=1 Tax=Monocercomonoides exilis TaxID=2049356 RepID=UPI00355976A9|nr:hypothetical protein MONOS_3371 [Monocercomonoides exilis]|eukprot:MONOS_3371.1-p1 / transcript=MONOS_3371.1 / gene=MONOS_3371 / organism=Monocercomonoides_exilis_PA203 / gene_product=unspecified product / transcript_product=unspecified product / location=Mono_scaffold00079:10431-16299(-) / protein_length=1880 / sequence_SO=supercontig / SO=protein_coding / is_pseudo=false